MAEQAPVKEELKNEISDPGIPWSPFASMANFFSRVALYMKKTVI